MNYTVANLPEELCMGCGICKGVCVNNAITYVRNKNGQYVPMLESNICNNCGICYDVCPGKGIEERKLYAGMKQEFPEDMVIGNVRECFNAKIIDDELRKKCTSGGMITSIIAYLLDAQLYDVAFCVDKFNYDEQVCTKPKYNYNDLEGTPQSRYVAVAHTEMIQYILNNRDKKVIIVGTGCVLAGVRTVIEKYHLDSQNYLLLGLFCAMSLSYNMFDYFKLFSKKKLEVLEFRTKENGIYHYGNVRLVYEDGEERYLHAIQRGMLKQYMDIERCTYCTDLLATFADISFGDNNTKSADGDSGTVIVRTELGKSIFEYYSEKFYKKEMLTIDTICDPSFIIKRGNRKKYADLYYMQNGINLYPDRESLIKAEEVDSLKIELAKKRKNRKLAGYKRVLFIFLQLRFLRIRFLKKHLLEPIEKESSL